MTRRPSMLVGFALWAALVACHHATDATPPCFVAPPEGTNQSSLTCVSTPGSCGTCGTGGASVSAQFVPPVTFAAILRFRLRGAKPRTTYIAQRAPERGRAFGDDGLCQRAEGLPPWTVADGFTGPRFVTFPLPAMGPKFTVTTDAAGDGSGDFDFQVTPDPGAHSGLRFDVVMRLVDDEITPTTELQTGCMTVVLK